MATSTALSTAATSTLKLSVGVAMQEFAALLRRAARDATQIFRTVFGLPAPAKGKSLGRYFEDANPLDQFLTSATDVQSMIAQGVTLRTAAEAAIAAAEAAATGTRGDFHAALLSAIAAVRACCASPSDALRLLEPLTLFDVTIVPNLPDAIGAEIATLSGDASVIMRRLSAIAMARSARQYQPSSQQDAAGVRDTVADVLDRIAIEAADRFEDATADAIDALRVAVVNDLTARGAALPPVVSLTENAPLPALVLAERLYADATRAADLVARNDPPHPGFLGLQLEALAS